MFCDGVLLLYSIICPKLRGKEGKMSFCSDYLCGLRVWLPTTGCRGSCLALTFRACADAEHKWLPRNATRYVLHNASARVSLSLSVTRRHLCNAPPTATYYVPCALSSSSSVPLSSFLGACLVWLQTFLLPNKTLLVIIRNEFVNGFLPKKKEFVNGFPRIFIE